MFISRYLCTYIRYLSGKMGLPTVITTDQGSEFKNQLNDEMMKILNIRHQLITAHHPQVDEIKRAGAREGVVSAAKIHHITSGFKAL